MNRPNHLEESIEGLEAAAWRNDPEAVRRCLKAFIPQFRRRRGMRAERDEVPAQSVAEARAELAPRAG